MTFPVPRHAALTSLALAIAAANAPANAQTTAIDSVIVTATRSAQLQRDVLSDVATITAEEIARSGAGSVVDLLQRQRGIEISRNGGPGTNSSVFIRGANSNQNVVLVDGVRIGSSTSGAANWSAIPLQSIDRIEIVYGPMSTLYGADAIGGVIQIFTKKGTGVPTVTAFAGAGSYNTREYDASVYGATGGEHSFSYALSAGREESDGFSSTKPGNFSYNGDDDGYYREGVTGQLGLQLARGHELGLIFLKSRTNAQFDSGTATTFDTHSVQKQENIALSSKNQILPFWHSTAQLSQSRDDSTSNPGTVSGYSRIDSKQQDFTWQNDFRLGEDTLQLLYGHRKEEVVSGTTPALGKERKTDSLAAAYNLKRGAHLASFSARNDDSSQYGSKVTGAAGYGYRVTNALRASASFGTSFRAPTFNELYYPGFGFAGNRPEKGRNAEASLQYDDGVTQLGATLYRNRLTDMLVSTTPCPKPGYTFGCAYNVNHVTLEGLTMTANRRFGAFNVSANADFQDPKDETTGKSLVRRAKRHGSAAVEYTAGALATGVELQASGSRFDDGANTRRLGGYTLLNLYATYQFARDWSVLARWNNATDKNYEVARTYATPGSSFFAGVRYGIK
ncbi:TonB-dependent receptor domain-containing protein [Pseudoduganella namucuonensis]|uniref:Vitamin B12 transporter n=1 Tax=Pseudoduganella namucuonensis TaxID=1035707 RepID=A0A1I7M6P0_9BURK|nr:TonB-dependent receptor [Pseudoduganella namucuonensis]SFV17598.1 vitamin B12 transporter [Pseudoduganella namucuonensis]